METLIILIPVQLLQNKEVQQLFILRKPNLTQAQPQHIIQVGQLVKTLQSHVILLLYIIPLQHTLRKLFITQPQRLTRVLPQRILLHLIQAQ